MPTLIRYDDFWSLEGAVGQLFPLASLGHCRVWILHCIRIVFAIFRSKYFLTNIRRHCKSADWTQWSDCSLPSYAPVPPVPPLCPQSHPCSMEGLLVLPLESWADSDRHCSWVTGEVPKVLPLGYSMQSDSSQRQTPTDLLSALLSQTLSALLSQKNTVGY